MAGGVPNRLVVGFFCHRCRQRWGWYPQTIPAVVEQKGAVRAFFWLAYYISRYRATTIMIGPLRAHLTCVAVALHNDCAYSAYGHARAIELHYLRTRNKPFPVTAETVAGWHGMGNRELADRMRGAMHDAGMHVEATWVQRILDLTTGVHRPVDPVEKRLSQLVRTATVMNRAVLASGVADLRPDGAMDPINRDTALRARLAAARDGAARPAPPAPGPPPRSLHGC